MGRIVGVGAALFAVIHPAWAGTAQVTTGKEAVEAAGSAFRANPWGWAVYAAAISVLLGLFAFGIIGPGAKGKHRDVTPHPWWIWFLSGVVTYLGASVGGGMVASFFRERDAAAAVATFSAAYHLAGIVIGALMARLIAPAAPGAGLSVRPGDLGRGTLALALATPLVLAVNMLAVSLYSRAHGGEPPGLAGHPLLEELGRSRTDPWVWARTAGAIILAPAFEELVFRAFLQSAVLRITGRAWLAIVVTSAAWGAVHLLGGPQSVPWTSIPGIFVLGLAMGTAFERTRRLGAPLAMHMIFNAANVLLFVAQTKR